MTVLTCPDTPGHDLGGTRFTSLATPRRGTTEKRRLASRDRRRHAGNAALAHP